VTIHGSAWNEPGAEAEGVVSVVRDALARWPGDSIGILVRSRSHAAHIVAALRAATVDLAATDLIELGRTTLANDLLAITRALVHAGDRLAWLTVLRAPWCGLPLEDLARIGAVHDGRTLYEIAREACAGEGAADTARRGLTSDGRARLARVVAAFAAGLERLGQLPLRDVVEGVWLELGGPAVAGRELPLADLILDEVGRHDVGGDCADVLSLAAALDRTRASLPGAGAPVQVLTIHKAKGLEFDTVIVPGLGRGIRREDRPALLWQELRQRGAPDLLLAPVNATGADDDRLYELLWDLRARQELAEADRLVYVAVTRARERLHLFGQTQPARGQRRDTDPPRPARGSLLDRLWPVLGPTWPRRGEDDGPSPSAAADPPGSGDPAANWRQPALRRLPPGWQRPPPPAAMALPRADGAAPRDLVVYDWASAWARHAGTVAHRWMRQIAVEGVEQHTPGSIGRLRPRFRQLLLRQGVEAAALDRAIERVVAVLQEALGDTQGRWLLSAEHAEQLNEYAVTVAEGSRFRHLIIDRAFVAADGVRWIIDYKTSSHEGGDREAFVRSEVERYGSQLCAYRKAFACLEQRVTRTALYFPLLRLLREVEPDDAARLG
jgi:ATP-dependent exoDNAse (exonuclease V) beta subunit